MGVNSEWPVAFCNIFVCGKFSAGLYNGFAVSFFRLGKDINFALGYCRYGFLGGAIVASFGFAMRIFKCHLHIFIRDGRLMARVSSVP